MAHSRAPRRGRRGSNRVERVRSCGYRRRVIYQHPLAYLLGIEGLALLRAWAGDYDEAFVRARLAEVRRLLDDPAVADHAGVAVRRGGHAGGVPPVVGDVRRAAQQSLRL